MKGQNHPTFDQFADRDELPVLCGKAKLIATEDGITRYSWREILVAVTAARKR
jgi:hypothetical protein